MLPDHRELDRASHRPAQLRSQNRTARVAANAGQSGNDSERVSSNDGPRLRGDDAVETIAWGGTLPSGRRAVVGGLSGLLIALVGNLGGITSFLLSLDGGKTAARFRFDALIPVNGYKRAVNKQTGYEFQYPVDWLVDQRLFRRAAEAAEKRRSLDPPALRENQAERRVAEPQIAYGPPGSTGEENVSIIAAPIAAGFKLEELGSAEQAAERFLSTTVAPPGSGREATLLSATSRRDENGTLYYYLELTVEGPTLFRHNVSVYAARGGLLYTLNVQCPEKKWSTEAAKLRPIAQSLQIL